MNMIFRVLLIVFFYAVITPVGMILRLMGIDYLSRSLDQKSSSYWTTKAS
jgi:hypothetical protein